MPEITHTIPRRACFRIRLPGDVVHGPYLAAFLNSPESLSRIAEVMRGATRPRVTLNMLREQTIPLAPLSEQHRIATVLDEQMAAVKRARAATEDQLRLLGDLVRAYLRDSFLIGTVGPISLNECLQEVSTGVGADWTQYRLVGATRGGLAAAKEPVGKNPKRYKLVEPGTIFYNPMRILLGSIGMVDDDEVPGITSPDYVVFRTVPGRLHARWFYYWLRSDEGAAFIKTLARGAVRERMLFRRLAEAAVTLPGWEPQVAAADRIRAVAQADRVASQQLEQVGALPGALLRRAFSGDGPDPSYAATSLPHRKVHPSPFHIKRDTTEGSQWPP